jgi:hypothetical protein
MICSASMSLFVPALIINAFMWQIRTENGDAVFATSARLRLSLLQELANGSAHRVVLRGFALAGLEQRVAGGHQKADQRSATAGIAATVRTRARRAATLFPDEQQLFE